jgi:hypothetical protein
LIERRIGLVGGLVVFDGLLRRLAGSSAAG